MALVFGVGVRDETFATREVTHLVEHLVMGTLPKSNLQRNGMTTVDSTHFHATGRPAAVAAFIEGVCTGLRELSLARADAEIGVLQAEDCSGVGGFVESMFAQRYGLSGLGVAYPGGPGPQYLSDDTITAHARRWFVAENAVLVCHGELPEGLRLDLPRGPRPVHDAVAAREQHGAAWGKSWAAGVGLMVTSTGPWDPALRVALDVVRERVQDVARTERGLSYSSGIVTQDVDRGRREIVLAVDAREGQEGAVATILWEQWRALCQAGPSPDELAHVVEGTQQELEDADEDDLLLGDLIDAAVSELLGLVHTSNTDIQVAYAGVTVDMVRDAARAVWASALLQVPEWSEFAGLPGLDRWRACGWSSDVPSGRTLRPSALVRVLPGAAKKRRFVLADDGVGHVDEDGDVHFVPWAALDSVYRQEPARDGAGKVLDGGGLVVIGRNACMFRIDQDSFGSKATATAAAHVQSKVPAERWAHVRPSLATAAS